MLACVACSYQSPKHALCSSRARQSSSVIVCTLEFLGKPAISSLLLAFRLILGCAAIFFPYIAVGKESYTPKVSGGFCPKSVFLIRYVVALARILDSEQFYCPKFCTVCVCVCARTFILKKILHHIPGT